MEQLIEKLRRSTQKMRVLFVEDHKTLHTTMLRMLQALFTEVDSAYDGKEAFAIYEQNFKDGITYDLIFSDIRMPFLSGVELSKKIKAINPDQEIIIFSAHQNTKELLEFINLGIRRFIPKPVSLEKLLHELQIVCDDINKTKELAHSIELSGDVYFDTLAKSLYVNKKEISLTPYELLIFEFLIEKINKTVSTQEIIDHLYLHMKDLKPDNLRKIIYKLRKKLPEHLIENLHSIGYRLKKQTSDN